MSAPPSLADDVAEAVAYANQGPSLSRETTRRLVRELTERTAGLDHLQRLFRLATRVEQRVGDAVECSCMWSYGRPGVRTARPADCPVHGDQVDGQPTEPTEADPYPDGLPEDLYVDIESTIHQHCGHDGQSDEANDWVTDLMAALTPLIGRSLVGGRPAAPTRDEIHDAIADALSEHVWAHGTGEIDGDGIAEAAQAVVVLLSRSAAEPPAQGVPSTPLDIYIGSGVAAEPNEEHDDG